MAQCVTWIKSDLVSLGLDGWFLGRVLFNTCLICPYPWLVDPWLNELLKFPWLCPLARVGSLTQTLSCLLLQVVILFSELTESLRVRMFLSKKGRRGLLCFWLETIWLENYLTEVYWYEFKRVFIYFSELMLETKDNIIGW